MSVYGVIYYRKNGLLPGARPAVSAPSSIEAQTQDAFDAGPTDDYAPLHSTEGEYGHPGRKVSWGRDDPEAQDDEETSYNTNYNGRRYNNHEGDGGDPFRDEMGRHSPYGEGGIGGHIDHDADYSYAGAEGRRTYG